MYECLLLFGTRSTINVHSHSPTRPLCTTSQGTMDDQNTIWCLITFNYRTRTNRKASIYWTIYVCNRYLEMFKSVTRGRFLYTYLPKMYIHTKHNDICSFKLLNGTDIRLCPNLYLYIKIIRCLILSLGCLDFLKLFFWE